MTDAPWTLALLILLAIVCTWVVWRTVWWARACRRARVIPRPPRDPHGRAIDAYGEAPRWRFDGKGKSD